MNRPRAQAIGIAILLSLPVSVGVWMGSLKMLGGGLLHPLVIGPGIVAGLGVFVLVIATDVSGSVDEDRQPGAPPG
ncbi:MAG: hypothetical protein SVG88_02915 [Halobacteriales archaeon]|nr:hypothetical protein [Halobacteriales archaeon]